MFEQAFDTAQTGRTFEDLYAPGHCQCSFTPAYDFYRKHPADAGYAPAWLYAASAHTALNAIRSRERRGRRETLHAVERDVVVDPTSAAERSETQDEVRTALARLDERAASLLALRYSGLSYEEIAAAMGLRKSSIGTLLARAEDAFRREVTR